MTHQGVIVNMGQDSLAGIRYEQEYCQASSENLYFSLLNPINRECIGYLGGLNGIDVFVCPLVPIPTSTPNPVTLTPYPTYPPPSTSMITFMEDSELIEWVKNNGLCLQTHETNPEVSWEHLMFHQPNHKEIGWANLELYKSYWEYDGNRSITICPLKLFPPEISQAEWQGTYWAPFNIP